MSCGDHRVRHRLGRRLARHGARHRQPTGERPATRTLGGLDAFDGLENARDFALDAFPETAAVMNAAFHTRIFDAAPAEATSRELNSPFFA